MASYEVELMRRKQKLSWDIFSHGLHLKASLPGKRIRTAPSWHQKGGSRPVAENSGTFYSPNPPFIYHWKLGHGGGGLLYSARLPGLQPPHKSCTSSFVNRANIYCAPPTPKRWAACWSPSGEQSQGPSLRDLTVQWEWPPRTNAHTFSDRGNTFAPAVAWAPSKPRKGAEGELLSGSVILAAPRQAPG